MECFELTGAGRCGIVFLRAEDGFRSGAIMTKSELIGRVGKLNPHLNHRDVERVVEAVFGEIATALAHGDRVELRGFGAFHLKRRDARTGRNPRTGAPVRVAEKHFLLFKTGKLLRELLNEVSDPAA